MDQCIICTGSFNQPVMDNNKENAESEKLKKKNQFQTFCKTFGLEESDFFGEQESQKNYYSSPFCDNCRAAIINLTTLVSKKKEIENEITALQKKMSQKYEDLEETAKLVDYIIKDLKRRMLADMEFSSSSPVIMGTVAAIKHESTDNTSLLIKTENKVFQKVDDNHGRNNKSMMTVDCSVKLKDLNVLRKNISLDTYKSKKNDVEEIVPNHFSSTESNLILPKSDTPKLSTLNSVNSDNNAVQKRKRGRPKKLKTQNLHHFSSIEKKLIVPKSDIPKLSALTESAVQKRKPGRPKKLKTQELKGPIIKKSRGRSTKIHLNNACDYKVWKKFPTALAKKVSGRPVGRPKKIKNERNPNSFANLNVYKLFPSLQRKRGRPRKIKQNYTKVEYQPDNDMEFEDLFAPINPEWTDYCEIDEEEYDFVNPLESVSMADPLVSPFQDEESVHNDDDSCTTFNVEKPYEMEKAGTSQSFFDDDESAVGMEINRNLVSVSPGVDQQQCLTIDEKYDIGNRRGNTND